MRLPAFTLTLALAAPVFGQPQHIAPTNALSPADELKTFKLPAGFVAQLVAAEPDIQKPMQCSFDAKGRLWVTTSHAYPFPADKPHDKLFVLADFGPDGKAKTITTFADDLNIPIGILPLGDGSSAIVSEVGRIVKLTDTNGDGKADKRDTLFTGFGTRDTHGMTNSFTLMPDGWVYACHGYLNESRVKGTDGHEVHMQSGHTFRFRPDGSRIEIYTRGQVNPFGMTVDPWGHLYTADCHSKPITQLIPGACYDSFGKPHDGLGYAPHVTRHDHGSTALCGLAWYTGDQYPADFRDNMFLGNVVTNRINRDKIEWKGSTPVAVEQPDFLTSSDPWFRPTDIKLGPDGALYVTDFYNKIIGHYEVDLKHPQRDKDHGRVWRIVYTGKPDERRGSTPPKDADAVKALRAMAAKTTLTLEERKEVLITVGSDSPILSRAAVDALIAHTDAANVPALMRLLLKLPAGDTHLYHAAMIALRDQLFYAEAWHQALAVAATDERAKTILDRVSLGSTSRQSAWWLADRMRRDELGELRVKAAGHVARYGTSSDRNIAWNTIGESNNIVERTAMALSFRQAMDTISEMLPPPPVAVKLRVEHGVTSDKDAAVVEALQLGTSMNVNVTLTAFDLLKNAARGEAVRMAALDHLLSYGPKDGLMPTCGDLVRNPDTPTKLRDKAINVLASSRRPQDLDALAAALALSAYRPSVPIATMLASSVAGADRLFDAVKTGKASPRLLQEKLILDRLRGSRVRDLDARVAELTKGIPSADATLAALIKDRGTGYKSAKPDIAAGKKLYATHCAACHQMANVGGKVGPNLDGIGNRGLDRLLEDVLDPNRNVDIAFRATTLDLTDGRKLTGLLQRQDGAVLVFADAEGKEQRIPVADVEKRTTTSLSPMPANVGEKITPREFYDLMGYLLDQRAK